MDERTMLRYVDELQGQIDRLKKMAGGGGGTKDYDKLNNRPKVNNITLTGNKKSSDLKIAYNMTEADYESATKNPESIYFLQENAGTITDSAYVNLEVADWTEVSGVYKQTKPFVFEVTPAAGWTIEDVSIETGIATVDSYEVTADPFGLSITYAAETLPEYGITATVTVTIKQPAGSTRIVKNGVQFGGVAGSVKYSETEHMIGTWLNNKPVYEITLNLTTSSGDSEAAITLSDYGVQNIDDVVGIEALSTSGGTGGIAPNYYAGSSDRFNIFMTSKTTLTISHYGSWTLSQKLYVTLRYTKTTD